MHDIEPYYHWRDLYIASEDRNSPFYGKVNSEFGFTDSIYNYVIHPQWDAFGSPTLYTKLVFADYDQGFAILDFIGEWNDCVTNDIMYLKRDVCDPLINAGISKFILICENVLNFHGSDDCYYEEWQQDVVEENGYIAFVNMLRHVEEEMRMTRINDYTFLGGPLNEIRWRGTKPGNLVAQMDRIVTMIPRELPG